MTQLNEVDASLLISIGQTKLANSLILLGQRHDAISGALRIYSQKRSEFGAAMSGLYGSDGVQREAALMANPLVAELRDLARQIGEMSAVYSADALALGPRLSAALRAHFKGIPDLINPSASPREGS
jgi:hypothetical protein